MARLFTAIITALLTIVLCSPTFAGDRSQSRPKVELRYKLVEIYRKLPGGGREALSALSLNDRGDVLVAGSLRPTPNNDDFIDGYPRPRQFIWRHGRVVTELVSPHPVLFDVEGRDINNRGEVVGSLTRYDPGFSVSGAFVWRRGQFTLLTSLPSPPGGYQFATAFAANDWGEVVGSTTDTDNDLFSTPFRWYRGESVRVPVDPVLSAEAVDINNWGKIVGNSRPDLNAPQTGAFGGFIVNRNGQVRLLETIPGTERMFAEAINDRGQVIGEAGDRAVLWEDGVAQDLGTLPGAASADAVAINVFGTIVGWSGERYGDTAAMIWKEGRMHDLNEFIADDDPIGSTVHLTAAADINNFGWIVANGLDADDPEGTRPHAYLLLPVLKKRH